MIRRSILAASADPHITKRRVANTATIGMADILNVSEKGKGQCYKLSYMYIINIARQTIYDILIKTYYQLTLIAYSIRPSLTANVGVDDTCTRK